MITCNNCKNVGWVCECHPTTPWPNPDGEDCCIGPGMPCDICNPSDRDNPPRMHEDMTTIWDVKDGWRH